MFNIPSFLPTAKFLCVVLLAFLCTGTLAGQSTPTHKRNCAAYHKERVLFLLHCCGDLEKVDYPGPPFAGDLTDAKRADLALREIDVATRTCTSDRLGPDYLSLQLDVAGAELMKARTVAVEKGSAWNEVGSSAGRATAALRRFYRDHPAEAASVWKVIEGWMEESGGPWQALEFINSLPAGCCATSELARIRGDLFAEVGLDAFAAQSYSDWIEISGTSPKCGDERSLSNIDILRRHRFNLPVLKEEEPGTCVLVGGNLYYVILPAKPVGKAAKACAQN